MKDYELLERVLSGREASIIQCRVFGVQTVKEIAERWHISRSRVYQIEHRALIKMRPHKAAIETRELKNEVVKAGRSDSAHKAKRNRERVMWRKFIVDLERQHEAIEASRAPEPEPYYPTYDEIMAMREAGELP